MNPTGLGAAAAARRRPDVQAPDREGKGLEILGGINP
jgi:hypothetical protein